MTRKMICFDIDGTLLTSKGEINPSAYQAIHQLQKDPSFIICIATGRGPYMFEEIRTRLNIGNYISYNGQYCVAENQEVLCNPLDPKELLQIILRAETQHIPLGFMTRDYTKTTVSEHQFVRESFRTVEHEYPIVGMPNLDVGPIYQGELFCTAEQEKNFLLQQEYFRFVRWHPYAVDILPPNGSKLEGIKKMADFFAIDMVDVIAFGDGLNDLEMIQNVGFGICMRNGVQQLKQVADYVTDSNDGEGILNALKYLQIV